MSRLLGADMYRMFHGKCFWLCLGGMMASAAAFVLMQYTAVDYTVPLSRVIFLPMSFYGVATAALASWFVGEDFSGGFIRNKMIAGRSRCGVFSSSLAVCWAGCVAVYLAVTLFTAALARPHFEDNVAPARLLQYLVFGIGMCLAHGSIYCTAAMLCKSRAAGVVLCVGLSFFLLVACLHTNQVMVQPEYRDGAPNPAYVGGFAKKAYALLHDLNPMGQAVQLSTMDILHPLRWILCDVGWMLAAGAGGVLFRRADIR